MIFGNPNPFAYLALFGWIPVTFYLFWKHPAPKATVYSVLGSIMFLPEAIAVDPPLLPPMDKTSLAMLWCLIACLWRGRSRLKAARPLRGIDILLWVLLLGNIGTSLTNPDFLVTGQVVRPALTFYDAFALSIKDTLSVYLPFFLGRAMLRSRQDLVMFSRALVNAGLIYSVLALIEIRLSPQLHKWLYGYYQMDFSMTLRFGGYRPMIFMATGIAVGMFMMGASSIAISESRLGTRKTLTTFYMMIVTVFVKSTGAILYGFMLWPVMFLVKKHRIWLPAFFAGTALFYPALRTFDVFPHEDLVEMAGSINEERALSLWFRFDQEGQLLERARERIYFGWGGYDRNRIFAEDTGEDLSVTDGDWAIQVGTRGIVGFGAFYGMLALPVLFLVRRIKRVKSKVDKARLGALAMFTSLLVLDLLPNGLFNSLPLFMSGALWGLSTGVLLEQRAVSRKRRMDTTSQIKVGATGAHRPIRSG